MITESRRLYTSATTPVGTSNRKADTSSVVPTSTSCKALNPTILTW